jgi:hypothetical protein
LSEFFDEADEQPGQVGRLGRAGPADDADVAPGRAFGEKNRKRLIDSYFADAGVVFAHRAWVHVYRLLLWIDRTTGLAHCYESDKCQPGRPWYARSLAFHDWVSKELEVTPGDLVEEVDLLFRWATADLTATAARRREKVASEIARQRQAYAGRGFPEPGSDPELEEIILSTLDPYLKSEPPLGTLRRLTERIQAHVGQENKRKNLVGEGFEDTVAALLRTVPGIGEEYSVRVRPYLHDLPGFHPPRGREKPRQVDLALIGRSSGKRILVSCKWSVRSDREEQFVTDFRSYTSLEASGEDFEYVLLTNEFDPARLAAACDMRRENARLFTAVVHVNPEGPLAAYGAPTVAHAAERGGQARMIRHYSDGRLAALGAWLVQLGGLEPVASA